MGFVVSFDWSCAAQVFWFVYVCVRIAFMNFPASSLSLSCTRYVRLLMLEQH